MFATNIENTFLEAVFHVDHDKENQIEVISWNIQTFPQLGTTQTMLRVYLKLGMLIFIYFKKKIINLFEKGF